MRTVRVELVTLRQTGIIPTERSTTEPNQHSVKSAAN